MKRKISIVIEWLLIALTVLAACLVSWIIGDINGIRYQRDLVKLPSSNSVANYFELNSEHEMPLTPLTANQTMAIILLMNKGTVDCWIQNESSEAMTEVMHFEQDGSFVFIVPMDGMYTMMLKGEHTSFNISMITYEK